MRRDKWLALPISAVLSFCIAFAGVMCLQSAMELEANITQVAIGCAVVAVLFSLGFTVKWWYASLVPVLTAVIWLWIKGSLLPSVEWLVYKISGVYNSAYNYGVLYWSQTPPVTGDTTLALCLAGCIVAFVCAWVICRRKPAVWAVLTAALPLAACFAVTDTVPKARYLYLLLLGVVVLLLTQLTRRRDIRKGSVLTLLVAVPAALAAAVLFWTVPKDTYQGQERADRILETVQSWIEDLSEQGPAGTSTAVKQSVDLDKAGRLVQAHTPVMTVSIDAHNSATQNLTGTYYLRQQGFQMYDGTSWRIEYGGDLYAAMDWSQLEKTGVMTVSARDIYLMKFTPYYAQGTHINPEGFTENTSRDYSYDFQVFNLPADAPSAQAVASDGELHVELPIGTYPVDAISLPGQTVAWAEAVVAPLIEEQYTVKDQAEAIGAYVRSLARYDKNTARMPADQTDFAKWFVTEADSGYCVHYATTATVLLRAAGIHAQYVEGYVARVPQEGTAVTVYDDQAHAWVEYFDPAVGWRILEATPAEGVPTKIRVPQGQTQNTPQQAQTQPEQNTPQQNPQQEQPKGLWKGWLWILGALAAAAVVILQWQLRLRYLRRRLSRGTVNGQAVQLWREVARLAKWCKRRPKPELYAMAQKARFSHHELTEEELAQLRAALEDNRKALKAKGWYWQPVYTLILVIY